MAIVKTQKDKQLSAFFTDTSFIIEEEIIEEDGPLKTWMEKFKEDKYTALFHMGLLEKGHWFSPSIDYLRYIAELLIKKISQQPDLEISRDAILVDLNNDEIQKLIDETPFIIGMEHVNFNWISRLWENLLAVFRKEIKSYKGSVSRYFAEYNSNINIVGRVFFHLVESKDEEYPFAFMATYTTKTVKSKKATHTPLKNALKEFDGEEKKLLNLISTVLKAADKSQFISDLLESGDLFSPLKLTVDEAYIILKEIPIYEESGVMCRIPDWWRKKSNSIKLSITVGENEPSKVGLDAIIDFHPTLSIEDDQLTEKELRDFLNMAEGLIQYKGKWVEVNKDKLSAVIKAFDKVKEIAAEGELSLSDAMRLELGEGADLNLPVEDFDISINNGQWLKTIKDKLVSPVKLPDIKPVPSLCAELRPYQVNGYKWLCQMYNLRLGACLADDMGLGKTVQIIALLEYSRTYFGGKSLLIIPASLIGNWQKEIERFAPKMPFQILHKSALRSNEEIEIKDSYFLYITTYAMAAKLEELRDIKWDCLILDEAQAIKNPGTKQTKAIKQIPSKIKFAMTGTPIENRLSDLWSLFDFLNQGLLGTVKEFTNFTKELGNHSGAYVRLRKMIQPFILRRLKTDKSIITDLPDKLEVNAYTSLSNKQVVLYKKLIREIEAKLKDSEGIERKGLILSSIMKFKQICNHPDQYIGRAEFKPKESGKFEHMKEICEVIRDKKERVLIFTQFKEMTEPISDFLTEIFGKKGFVLHGGTPVKKRSDLVKKFNGEQYIPYMVLSLKAGGVGLNLTSANHVIHFDRWWNPAVENQATDRVFRIGQTKNVIVHKFVTKGTIEEKINAILEDKQKLSGEILGNAGEHWITEYDNKELMELFTLGG